MTSTLIKNCTLVNEGQIIEADLRIQKGRIEQIGSELSAQTKDQIVDAEGAWLLPGMIDDQVHFREPGLTHKGTIASESKAAVAGGITSYMEMPNVSPSTTTIDALHKKYEIARVSSAANYAFYLGATEDNLEEIKALDPQTACGVKVFMGASTGNLLVENPVALEGIFRDSPVLIVTHCESGPVISQNQKRYDDKGIQPVIQDHPIIRDAEACYRSSSCAVQLARKYSSQLHVLHITTEKELALFEAGPVQGKNITAEACVHHLWFSDQNYPEKRNLIRCNPANKSATDRHALIAALHDGRIDIIATDHAPHTWDEKQQPYPQAPAGLPLVEHALLSLIDHVKAGRMSIEQVVEKVCHNPAIRYGIRERGYLREGYFADLVLVDPKGSTAVSHGDVRYLCGWSPFDSHTFQSKILSTWVNGSQVFDGSHAYPMPGTAAALRFDRS
ncbi:dihydroorotase [Neptuniibacter caesariensis]|uniref:Allantoinase n=1 Tax=Neptuniibacter caesariensis TaxID=207954 RepID=A0A7U8C868_NEPCE|nr:dihydroorotase [Neptuniibacter caesariensis]EAR61880.1 Allantoinase [Oceanospirillum sp. MED92] [Neptuniibacter caesariensis]